MLRAPMASESAGASTVIRPILNWSSFACKPFKPARLHFKPFECRAPSVGSLGIFMAPTR
jgi:hypothetical protein